MEQLTIRLGLEEMACALSLLGDPDAAGGYLFAVLGERPSDEIQGRLWSAFHSLAARNLVTVEVPVTLNASPNNAPVGQLNQELAALVEPILHHDVQIRCSVSTQDRGEQNQSFFIRQDIVIEMAVERQIVVVLKRLRGTTDLIERSRLFCFPETELITEDFPSIVLSADLFSELRTVPSNSTLNRLMAAGFLQAQATALLDAFNAESARGSVLCIEMQSEQPVANEGLLFLHALSSHWIFELLPGPEQSIKVHTGHPETFDRLMRTLVTSRGN